MSQALLFIVIAALFFVDGPRAFAQAVPEEIIVTADPLSGIDAHLATPAGVLDRDALRRGNDRNVGEAIANTLGASVADFGPSVGRPVLRGLSGARVRVLENGIGAMDVATLGADHAVAVDSVFADQVEIFRGPATLLYGSGASGGFVNVVNQRIPSAVPKTMTGELRGEYDSATEGGLGGLRLTLATGDSLAWHVEYAHRAGGDYSIPGYAATHPEPDAPRGLVEHSDGRNQSLAAGVAWLGERGTLGFAISGLDNGYGIPGEHHEHAAAAPAGEDEGTRVEQRQTRFDVKAEWRFDTAAIRKIALRWGHNAHRQDELEDGALGTRLDNAEWEGRLELLHGSIGAFDGVAGMQVQHRDFTSGGDEALVPQSDYRSIAGFIFEKADLGALHADLGLRFESSTARTASDRAEFGAWSLSGGLNHDYREQGALGFSLTYAERAPALEELFAQGPHLASRSFEYGAPGLRLEQALNADLTWRERIGRVAIQVNGFQHVIDDFVYLREQDTDGDGRADRVEPDFLDTGLLASDDDALLLLRQTQRDARFRGYEAELTLDVLANRPGALRARLWTDYVRGRLQGGDPIPRLTPRRAGLDLDFTHGAFDADFAVTRVFARNVVATLETETAGYTMLDLGAGYTFTPAGEATARVSLRASNLLDTEARRHTSFLKDEAPLPGRAIRVGVSITF